MLKRIAMLIPVFAIIATVGAAPAAMALDCATPQDCASDGIKNAETGSKQTDIGSIITSIVNILLFIIGAVAVIMVVIGGFKYVVSNGESAQVKSAKDTIFYAVIGLVVATLAYAIVNWVISALVAGPTPKK